jgi:hypothetical protein
MKVVELVGEIRAHEMSVFGISEKSTTSNSITFKANAKKTPKLKMIKHETNSSEQEDSHESSSSDEDDIAGVALTDLESPLPPPPMCLMAKGNSKVYDGESDESDDEELGPNEFSNLIHEYTCIIKREKGKVKKLESAHSSFESSHNDLLAKYNALLKEHDESLVLSKQVSDQYNKLKVEHVDLK